MGPLSSGIARDTSGKRTVLLLIRHGETQWNVARRVQGQKNSDLTELGRRQANGVARLLARGKDLDLPGPPTALYSSDLPRAVRSAEPIAEALSLTIHLDPGLREMSFGRLEGLPWLEMKAELSRIREVHFPGEPLYVVRTPGGESKRDMYERSRSAIEAIAGRHLGETVAVVSHGGVIDQFSRAVLRIPFDEPLRFSTRNASLSAFVQEEDGFKLRTWGIAPNLEVDHVDSSRQGR